mgnify:CR=1 FL=1
MNKTSESLPLIFLVLLLFSCKKDKLKGDSEILIGKWNWTHTIETYETCNPPTFENTLTPETENANYSIEFFEKGKVAFYENEQEVNSYRVVLHSFDSNPSQNSSYPFGFTIYLDNEYENAFWGFVSQDSLFIREDFPFPDTDCEEFNSYFVRE